MNIIKKGTAVTINGTTLVGTVKSAAIVDDDKMSYLVGYTDADGNAQEKHFLANQITAKE